MATSRVGGLFPGIDAFRRQATKKKEAPLTFKGNPKQNALMDAVTSGLYTFLGTGGGIRGGKSFGTLAVLITLHRMFPRARSAIVRKDLPTLRRNIIPTMDKLRLMSGGFIGPLNMSTWSYPTANGGDILLFAEQATHDPTLERWKGLEVNWFLLEEASELQEASGNKAIERAGSYIIPPLPEDPEPRQPPPFVFVTFNPCKEWPRKWFYEPWKLGTLAPPYCFIPLTIDDNPYATDAYKKSLTYLPKEEYNRFVKGEWDFVDDPNQLIKTEWIWGARNVDPTDGPFRLGADVARYGDDYSTTARIRGNALVEVAEYKHLSTDRFGTVILNEANDRTKPVAGHDVRIDGVGLGAGTVDYCRKMKLPVREVISGAKAIPRPGPLAASGFRFKDLRSQMWWEFREKLREGKFSLALRNAKGEEIPIPEKLVGDLAAPRYEISGDKVISVESKDDIKLRLGRSTDYGDAVVYAAFDFPPPPRGPVLPGSTVVRDY